MLRWTVRGRRAWSCAKPARSKLLLSQHLGQRTAASQGKDGEIVTAAASQGDDGEIVTAEWQQQAPQRAPGSNRLNTGATPSAAQVVEELSVRDQESLPRFQKPFVDRLWMEAKAGNGGNPAKGAVRSPGLQGAGYAGNGGSVFFKATHLLDSFLDVPQKIKAKHGEDGGAGDHSSSRGRHADDFCVQVPLGTILRERIATGERTEDGRRMFLPRFVYQFLRTDDTYVVAKGGFGGVGPRSFKKRDGRKGTPGHRMRVELELRIMNDCAFVGLPNAGKTALLAALSRAHTRISPEAFSTTRPHVGTILYSDRVEIKVADLPGVVQGAHLDTDMGRRVLRHTYRSRALVFVVNMDRGERPESDALQEVEMLREEACRYDPLNREKPWMVVGTKCDRLNRDALFHLDSLYFRLRGRYGPDVPVIGTSSRFGLGLTRLVRTIRSLIYPDLLETTNRVPAQPVYNTWLPGVLHERFDMDLPSLPGVPRPLLLPRGTRAAQAGLLTTGGSDVSQPNSEA